MSDTSNKFPPERKVAPYQLPVVREVKPEGIFKLDDQELFMFDGWSWENTRIGGTECDWWCQDVVGSTKDPLYNEPEVRKWKGPFRIIINVTWPEGAEEVQERGFKETWSATAWISRKEVENAKMPHPQHGDVVLIWNVPFFREIGDVEEEHRDPKDGFYFDVATMSTDGHPFDTPGFVGFKCELKRRTEFTPERRVNGE